MAILFLQPQQLPDSGPVHISIHVVTTLDVSAEETRRQVNRDVVTEASASSGACPSCSRCPSWAR